jgi:hypothetical protein
MDHVQEVVAGDNISVSTQGIGGDRTKVVVTALSGMTATAAELNTAADASTWSQTLTASGAVLETTRELLLNHVSTPIAATIATAVKHPGWFFVKNISATGTEDHTVTLTAGTWNGTNAVATLDLLNEALLIWFDTLGNGTIIVNTGAVSFSG